MTILERKLLDYQYALEKYGPDNKFVKDFKRQLEIEAQGLPAAQKYYGGIVKHLKPVQKE